MRLRYIWIPYLSSASFNTISDQKKLMAGQSLVDPIKKFRRDMNRSLSTIVRCWPWRDYHDRPREESAFRWSRIHTYASPCTTSLLWNERKKDHSTLTLAVSWYLYYLANMPMIKITVFSASIRRVENIPLRRPQPPSDILISLSWPNWLWELVPLDNIPNMQCGFKRLIWLAEFWILSFSRAIDLSESWSVKKKD